MIRRIIDLITFWRNFMVLVSRFGFFKSFKGIVFLNFSYILFTLEVANRETKII